MTAAPKPEHRGRIIRAEIRTAAPPERIWAAWTDPEKIAQWFVDGAEGKPEVGSTFTWKFDRFGYVLPYQVIEAVPGEKFSLMWSQPQSDPGILEVTLSHESGQTLVRLINSGFGEDAAWEDEYQGVVSGWQMALAVMKHYAEHYFGEPKAMFMAMRPADFTYEQLRPYYFTSPGLGAWLARSGGIGEVGARCELDLVDAGKLTGTVLARSAREIALSWNEIRGTLELKAFAMGPGRRTLCIRGYGWRMDAGRAQHLESQMGAALERLAAALAAAQ
jgi:uncharacterized protein YndB with AHSA1/START domain